MKRNPGFLELGHRYGAEDAEYDETLADLWKDKFSELVRLDRGEGITLHENWCSSHLWMGTSGIRGAGLQEIQNTAWEIGQSMVHRWE